MVTVNVLGKLEKWLSYVSETLNLSALGIRAGKTIPSTAVLRGILLVRGTRGTCVWTCFPSISTARGKTSQPLPKVPQAVGLPGSGGDPEPRGWVGGRLPLVPAPQEFLPCGFADG